MVPDRDSARADGNSWTPRSQACRHGDKHLRLRPTTGVLGSGFKEERVESLRTNPWSVVRASRPAQDGEAL